MKPLFRSFLMFFRQIYKDSMLSAALAGCVLAAFFFRFGVPVLERVLCSYFGKAAILAPYYLLFDLFLSLITPYLFLFVSAMVMLSEYDENLSSYLAVTPVGKRGYIVSRLVFPAAASLFVSLLFLRLFSLTGWRLLPAVTTCLLTSLSSLAAALLIFSFSHNRVEGMAMAKMSGLLMLGLPVPFFLSSGVSWLFCPLPSFWIAKLCLESNPLFLPPALLTAAAWIWLLCRRLAGKLA
ncbi:hypothetical protein SDC9_49220 [bioreactor metagenome]|uniref:Fluoroquinolones export permease protein n=1 Tax=bioreactor metagenome TaxID=1076179 RepID=A0A644WHM2_9ZZZZ